MIEQRSIIGMEIYIYIYIYIYICKYILYMNNLYAAIDILIYIHMSIRYTYRSLEAATLTELMEDIVLFNQLRYCLTTDVNKRLSIDFLYPAN